MAVKFGYIKSKIGTILGVTPFYPIGYIIEETSGINPEKWYGGVWELYGKGCVTACINSADTDANSKTNFNKQVGTVIGSKYMQNHHHEQVVTANEQGDVYRRRDYQSEGYAGVYPQNAWTIDYGSGDSENIQPTILIYRWRKIAY